MQISNLKILSYSISLRFILFFVIIIFIGLSKNSQASETYFCFKCHPSATSTAALNGIPHLAGQNPDYILRQLVLFSNIENQSLSLRVNPTMEHKTKLFPPAEWSKVAQAIARMECVYTGISNLAYNWENPCADCHGEDGISLNSITPNLAGQNLTYLLAQTGKFQEPYLLTLKASKKLTATKRTHPVMGPISANINGAALRIMRFYSLLPCREETIK